MEMEDAIVLYAAPFHLDVISLLANFITKHYPAVSVVMVSTAAVRPSTAAPSIAYRRLPTPGLTQSSASDWFLEVIFESAGNSNPDFVEALREISRRLKVRAIIVDFFCYPAFEVSSSLRIPTYFCHTTGASGLCHLLYAPTIHETSPQNMGGLDDLFEIPGCPQIRSWDLPKGSLHHETKVYEHIIRASMTAAKSDGIIVNTFRALENRAMEALANGLCVPNAPTPPVYPLGPFIADKGSKNGGGGGAEHECMRWLDSQPSKSVVFLCFGRKGVFSVEQLKEMALGLENSGCRFLWAVRSSDAAEDTDLEALLPEGFLARTKERGLVLKSWAPQRDVLSHDSVGGFVTHCGQSSVLEAVSSGVPMIGWPLYAEQRLNRISMVEEMRVALPLEEAADGFVTAAELEKRVLELIESRTGKEVRRRVTEMKRAAAAAVGKGGSSLVALEKFMQTVTPDLKF